MAKDPRYRPSDAGRLAAELRDAATDSYGADWEDRGRSYLAEAALLLLALLWPSGAAPAVGGTTVAHPTLTEPPAEPAQSTGTGHSTSAQPQPSHPQLSPEARHAAHLRHLDHLEHLRAERAKEKAQAEHAAHLHHVEHVEHVEHVADVSRGDGQQPTRRRPRPRGRARAMTVVAAAVIAAVVIGVVAALAATSHHSPPPSGAPSPGTSTAGPGTPGNTQAGSHQAAGTGLADHKTWCGSAFIADDLLNVYIIRGSETCSSTVQSIFNSYGNKLLENPGSSGNFTIDGWSCSHKNVPESQATGVWAVCTQGGAMMETMGGPVH